MSHITLVSEEKCIKEAAGSTVSGIQKARILVVEDNILNQKVIRYLLEELGYQVCIAANGRQALEMFGGHYAAVFMDLGLPDSDGCDICREIRKHEQGKTVPIFALTASGEHYKEKCLQAGMNYYMRKPVFSEQIQSVLQEFNV